MRLAFFGTPHAASPSLLALLHAGHDVALVVTQPDRPAGRSNSLRQPPVKEAALAHGLPVVQPERVRGQRFTSTLRQSAIELLVVVAYGRLLSRSVLDLVPGGAINLHFSLLPRYRGAAPVAWALAAGETQTGVTTMRMVERLDAGPVLMQRVMAIAAGEHAPALEARLAARGAELLVETLEGLERGRIEPREQDESCASWAPRLAPEDGDVDPRLSARAIEGRVRGFDPWPGAWVRRGERRVRLIRAHAVKGQSASPPGTILELTDGGLLLACGDGSRLMIQDVKAAGGRVIAARDAVNGRLLAPGDRIDLPPARP